MLNSATRDLAKLLWEHPNIARSISRGGEIAPSARMIYGMSACGETGDRWLEVHLALEAGRDERKGYTNKSPWLYASQDHEPVELLRYSDELGESSTLYFWFDPSKMDAWGEGPDYPYDDPEVVEGWLRDYYGVGHPCGCGVCAQGGDCCGRWFAHSLDIWPAQNPRRVREDGSPAIDEFGREDWKVRGNWRWYGRVRFSQNI